MVAAEPTTVVGEWIRAFAGLRHNPLLLRELRGWRRLGRDWRLWVGLRIPRGLREWGLPAVVWFSLAPYVIWASVVGTRRVAPSLPPADNALIFGVVVFALFLYACIVIALASAVAIVGERQRGSWDPLLATPLTAAELVLGCLAGSAGPVLTGVLVSILIWALARPHYAALLEPVGGLETSPGTFLVFGAAMLVRMSTLGALGIAVSSRARHGGIAMASALALAITLLALELLVLQGLQPNGSLGAEAASLLVVNLLVTAASLELARRWVRRTE